MQATTEVSPTARQVSAYDPERRFILSVLVKRTYSIDPDGRLSLAEPQLPLCLSGENCPDNPDLVAQDTDLYTFKLATDVVVKGHAHAPSPTRELTASVRVGAAAKSVRVVGDRRCSLSAAGKILFSDPAPVEEIPLRYDRAYGGKDAAAEERHGNPYAKWQPYFDAPVDVSKWSPFFYPRNPCGVGYLIEATHDAVERLELPNLEDPLNPLSPDRIVTGSTLRWPLMPLPQAFDWVSPGWFPRGAYLGVWPEHDPLKDPIAEVARGFAPPDLLEPGPVIKKFSLRLANGASLGLQLPYLRGDEECRLIHIHPKRADFQFRLPGERPKIWTDGRNGKLNETEPVIHTVLIEPEESRVCILWRGCAPALRPYLPEELEKMPFKVEWA